MHMREHKGSAQAEGKETGLNRGLDDYQSEKESADTKDSSLMRVW